ncbi:lysophospholipid acyltransferase family protein [Gilvirhabdus luticola]|uniref:lysophospholipid acyltransferase family protein n=1 Tax=Gilvirhabdus luticola TaxID=3079858 RepID=UPI00391C31E8
MGLFFYYRRIHVYKVENIPKDKPILFLSNHQNALLDALLIATTSGRFSYFLTRASVFTKPIVIKLLRSLQMLPVYRIRDGWSNLTNNNPIFESCTELLKNNEAVVIFPEGSHNLKRTVRPLSKGFTRIVFDTLEKYPKTELQLVSVGLNFESATAYGDSCSIFYGKAISAKKYITEDRNQSVVDLKEDIHDEISKLTTHIESEGYEDTLNTLKALNADFLNPKAVNACIKNDFNECGFMKTKRLSVIKTFLKFVLIINLIVPFAIWKLLIQPKIIEEEFIGTFRFAVGISLVPMWILAVIMLLASMVSFQLAMMYLFFVLGLSLLTVKT